MDNQLNKTRRPNTQHKLNDLVIRNSLKNFRNSTSRKGLSSPTANPKPSPIFKQITISIPQMNMNSLIITLRLIESTSIRQLILNV